MDEKIEEMAKALAVNCGECYTCKYYDKLHCTDLLSAEELYKAGYRKESDTAREIIRLIKLNGTLGYGGYVIHDSTIEQICKKYGVDLGEKWNG